MSKQFKAIETKFDGYHFRSRLEARWAVFFKTLGIEYQYESEGYILGGIPYLPDFYLPQHESFVEIKGQEPTKDEIQKARRLSLFEDKQVCILYGNIGFPDEEYCHHMKLITPASLYSRKRAEGPHPITPIHASAEILEILQTLHDAELSLRTNGYGEFWFSSNIFPTDLSVKQLHQTADGFQKHAETIRELAPLLELHKDEIDQTLSVEPDEIVIFDEQMILNDFSWTECNACGEIMLGIEDIPHTQCPHEESGTIWHNSPRLIKAYTAARQARFEREAKS